MEMIDTKFDNFHDILSTKQEILKALQEWTQKKLRTINNKAAQSELSNMFYSNISKLKDEV